jgi:hypothetical protein
MRLQISSENYYVNLIKHLWLDVYKHMFGWNTYDIDHRWMYI